MHEIAVTTLAAGGKGGGDIRLLIFVALLVVIVVLAAGWIMCAVRLRAARAGHEVPAGRNYPAEKP